MVVHCRESFVALPMCHPWIGKVPFKPRLSNSSWTDIEKSSDRNYIAILAILSHLFSRRSVHIKSPDIREKPEFGPNYLSHTLELELLARHTQFIDRLAHTEPL